MTGPALAGFHTIAQPTRMRSASWRAARNWPAVSVGTGPRFASTASRSR